MDRNPIDDFLITDQEGHLSKTDEGYKKDDELTRLPDPSKASRFRPMEHKVEELSDDGDILTDGLNAIVENLRPKIINRRPNVKKISSKSSRPKS